MDKRPSVIVIGATSDWGLAVVERFLADGFAVAMFDADATALDDLVRHFGERDLPAVGRRLAADNRAAILSAIADVASWRPRLRAIVHCPAKSSDSAAIDVSSLSEWADAAASHLASTGGALILVAPPAAKGDIVVASARGVARAVTSSLASLPANRKMSVNCILPGPDLVQDRPARVRDKAALPSTVAFITSFLVSPEANSISGQCLVVR